MSCKRNETLKLRTVYHKRIHQQYAEMHASSFTTVGVFAIEIINIFYFSLSCTKTVKESDDVFLVEVDIKLSGKN